MVTLDVIYKLVKDLEREVGNARKERGILVPNNNV